MTDDTINTIDSTTEEQNNVDCSNENQDLTNEAPKFTEERLRKIRKYMETNKEAIEHILTQENTVLTTTDIVAVDNCTATSAVHPLKEASSTFVNHLGAFITKQGSSDAPPASALMEDVQQMWKNKTSDHSPGSMVSTLWDSVKESEHLPTIAGMLASFLVKKP